MQIVCSVTDALVKFYHFKLMLVTVVISLMNGIKGLSLVLRMKQWKLQAWYLDLKSEKS